MDSYTYMSDEVISAIYERLPDHYDMSLNPSDMRTVIRGLRIAWENGLDDAGNMLSSIASTLTLEMI